MENHYHHAFEYYKLEHRRRVTAGVFKCKADPICQNHKLVTCVICGFDIDIDSLPKPDGFEPVLGRVILIPGKDHLQPLVRC